MPVLSLHSGTVDAIGRKRAQIAKLQGELADLEAEIKDSGPGAYEGRLFRITVSVSDRATVAWKKIAQKLGASRQMVTANTIYSEVTTLRCSARKAEKIAA